MYNVFETLGLSIYPTLSFVELKLNHILIFQRFKMIEPPKQRKKLDIVFPLIFQKFLVILQF